MILDFIVDFICKRSPNYEVAQMHFLALSVAVVIVSLTTLSVGVGFLFQYIFTG